MSEEDDDENVWQTIWLSDDQQALVLNDRVVAIAQVFPKAVRSETGDCLFPERITKSGLLAIQQAIIDESKAG